MWAEDDTIARLQCDQDFENDGGRRIGHRTDAHEDAYGFGDPRVSVLLVRLDDTHGRHVLVLVINVLRREVVLGHLVFEHAHPGLFVNPLGDVDATSCPSVSDWKTSSSRCRQGSRGPARVAFE